VIEEINDQLIIRNVTAVVASFLAENLPRTNAEIYLKQFLPERAKAQITSPVDLKRSDLYCNLRVLIGNNRFFRDAEIFPDTTVNGCARIVLSYRNRIAHQNLGEVVSIEHSQLEYIAVNRLISLLPTPPSIQELIEETRIYVGSALVYLAKEYFNTEIATSKMVEIEIRSANAPQGVTEREYEEADYATTNIRVPISEGKQLLRRLREQIQNDFDDLPKWRNILRESILIKIVEKRVKNEDDLRLALSEGEFEKTDPRQFSYFDKINEIIDKL